MPLTLDLALNVAEQAERELSNQPSLQPSGASQSHVRWADYERDEDGEECFQAGTSSQPPRQRPPPANRCESGADRRCFRHHGLDHLVRRKTTAEWPSEGTTAPESYPSPQSVRSGWRPSRVLVDTGSTISLVRPGVFPGTTGALSGGWTSTSVCLTTVTGQETRMMGRKRLAIRDSCIIGLDLPTRWGAWVDMAIAAITVGAETVALQSGRGGHRDSGGWRSSRRAMAREPRPLPSPCVPRGPVSAAFPSPETAEAVNALWLRSGVGLDVQQILECRYCLRQEERAHESPMALQTTEAAQTIGEAEGWLPLSARQLEQQQRADETLALVRDWLEAGQCPSWPEVSARGPEGAGAVWRYCTRTDSRRTAPSPCLLLARVAELLVAPRAAPLPLLTLRTGPRALQLQPLGGSG
ncbi:unnamed protein product [Arctogadus glacialis]